MNVDVKRTLEAYEPPKVVTLGSLQELTQVSKCGGSGDAFLPQVLTKNLTTGGCAPG